LQWVAPAELSSTTRKFHYHFWDAPIVAYTVFNSNSAGGRDELRATA